jgi:hypothetical protein
MYPDGVLLSHPGSRRDARACFLAGFDLQRVSLDFLHLLRDGSVGHGAIRHQVPRIMSFTGPTERLVKNVNFDRLLSTVRLRHGGDADERIALYVPLVTAITGAPC